MERHELEQLYNDSSWAKERWDLARFAALSEQRVHARVTYQAGDAEDQHARLPRKLEANEFGGIASAFNVPIDSWMKTYIEPGSFKNTLKDEAQSKRVKVMYNHRESIGKPEHMSETKTGLMVIGKVLDTSRGRDVMTLIRGGGIDEMSIGFDPIRYYYREDPNKEMCRHITEVRLWEFSAVDFGANPGAIISDFNSLEPSAVDRLAELISERLSRTQRIDEQDQEQVRREIQRLQGLLPTDPTPPTPPAQVREAASGEHMRQLEELQRRIAG